MCSQRVMIALVALLVVCAAPASGQSPEGMDRRERRLLARAESLLAQEEARVAARESAYLSRLRPRVIQTRGATLVVGEAVLAASAQQALDSGLTLLRTFGAVPERFAGRFVLYGMVDNRRDTLSHLGFGSRRLLRVDVSQTGPDSSLSWSVSADAVARALAVEYRDSLDADWRNWLPYGYAVPHWTRSSTWGVFQELTRSPLSVAGRCVAGEVAGCRLWLAIDRDAEPFADRFTGADLRNLLRENSWSYVAGASEVGHSCIEGVDAACLAFFRTQNYSDISAPETSRRGLLRLFRSLYGADALERAVADTAGSIAQRLARAAGVSEDSLVMNWRYWTLTRGGRPRDRSTAADAVPGLVLAVILLSLVVRGRRS
jgi:hypothetical protein